MALRFLGERVGSGDGERKAPMTQKIPYALWPASALFVLVRKWRLLCMDKIWTECGFQCSGLSDCRHASGSEELS